MKIDRGTERLTELMRKVAEVRRARATREAEAARRELAQVKAARTQLAQGEARAEAELLGDGQGVSAALMQLMASARQTHGRQLARLDTALSAQGETVVARESERLTAAKRHMGASRIAEYVKVSRQTSTETEAQKALEDMSRGRVTGDRLA